MYNWDAFTFVRYAVGTEGSLYYTFLRYLQCTYYYDYYVNRTV